MITEDFYTLAVDPGEDTGWSIWRGEKFIGAGTTKMWEFADAVWQFVNDGDGPIAEALGVEYSMQSVGRIVCENFRLYPWEAEAGNLNWDEVRTARLIGALYFIARLLNIDFELQGADIKERAIKGGAEEFFYSPLHENRHQNDSIMHGWYFMQMNVRLPARKRELEQADGAHAAESGPQSEAAKVEGGSEGGPGGK